MQKTPQQQTTKTHFFTEASPKTSQQKAIIKRTPSIVINAQEQRCQHQKRRLLQIVVFIFKHFTCLASSKSKK